PYYLYCLRLRRLVLIFVNPLYFRLRGNRVHRIKGILSDWQVPASAAYQGAGLKRAMPSEARLAFQTALVRIFKS
ncbi:hypothetical protein, partial [Neisseria meningitidis]|uniref:hypothetical protein n=1 Tax=Neisseria meningitidis TaxID=487 RepID=UPI0011CE7389